MAKTIKKLFRIGEVSKITGVPVSTLRHWLDKELFKPVETAENGDRLFDERQIKLVERIDKLRKSKTLDEIKRMLNGGR